jgi:DNA sulfur modification protein DndB
MATVSMASWDGGPYQLSFPAVRGVQAGREIFVAMCPLGLAPRLLTVDEATGNVVGRSQRPLNTARIPKIAAFLASNPTQYALPAITATVDGRVIFQPVGAEANWELGRISFPLTARLRIADGQHRWRAISEAISREPSLRDEVVPLVLYVDEGVERRQQLFADLNMHSVRVGRSLGILYDHRDPHAALARSVSEAVPIFAGRTEVQHSTVPRRSSNVFTLAAIYQATRALVCNQETPDKCGLHDRSLAVTFWTTIQDCVGPWKDVVSGMMTASQLRNHYVCGHGVALCALGEVGRTLIEVEPDWQGRLFDGLRSVDWSRTSPRWNGRAIVDTRVSKTRRSVRLTAIALKELLQLRLLPEESSLEADLRAQAPSYRFPDVDDPR